MKKLFTLLILLLFAVSSSWAIVVTIGTGTGSNTSTSYPAPYGNYWWGARHQLLYTAAELSAAGLGAGNITTIAFNVIALNGTVAHQGYNVQMKNTASTALTSTWETGLTTVLNPASRTPVLGWNTYTLDVPFNWDGTSNLLVEVCFNNSSYTYNASTQWTTGLAGNYAHDYHNDASGICANTSTSGLYTTRPNVQLNGQAGANPILVAVPGALSFGFVPYGGSSPEQAYVISGENLTAGPVVVTAPSGFGVSLTSGGPYTASVNVMYTPPTLPNTNIYVQFTPLASNTDYSGNITNVGGGASANVSVTGTSYEHKKWCTTSQATSTADEEIFNVTLGGINNTSDCSTLAPGPGSILNRYSNYYYDLTPADLPQGSTNAFSVEIGTCGGNYSNALKIFIDFNQDGDFTDTGEEAYVSPASTSGAHFETGNIIIPLGVSLGNTMMRIVNVETSSPSSITPCGSYTWGETEDYQVTIQPPILGYMQGYVYDMQGGCVTPLEGATVTNGVVSAQTDALGFYQFIDGVPVGTYSFTASKTDFIDQVVAGVVITESNTTFQNFCLEPFLAPPAELNATLTGQDVHLAWMPPDAFPAQWLMWDDGVNALSIGVNGPANFAVASRWPIADIAPYDGMFLKKIEFWPAEPSAVCTYTIKVWKGANAATELYSYVIPASEITEDTWNIITFPGIEIDGTDEFWFGYEINTTAGYPAGCDNGPEIAGKGNMINFGGWAELTALNPALTYNWTIHGWISNFGSGLPLSMMVQEQAVKAYPKKGKLESQNIFSDQFVTKSEAVMQGGTVARSARLANGMMSPLAPLLTLTGYNLYRNGVMIVSNTPNLFYDDLGLPSNTYLYDVSAQYDFGESVLTGPVQVDIVLCDLPTNQSTTNVTTQGADLDWNYAVDSFFDVFIDIDGGPLPGPGTIPTVSSLPVSSYSWTGGVPNQTYAWWVRADCGFTLPKIDYFWMAMTGGVLDPLLSGASFDLAENEDGIWYNYIQAPGDIDWWNVWFYNDPLDLTRMKKIRMGFWIQPLNPGPANIYYVVNWSTPGWVGTSFPTPGDEAYIERSPVNGPIAIQPGMQWIELSYIIPDYNPEWVSVDIWGDNIQILQESLVPPPPSSQLAQYWAPGSPGGIIVHECLPKPLGNNSSWVGPQTFFTGYCTPAPTSVDGLGITNVTFSTVNNTTGAEPGNYSDYSALVGDVQRTVDIPVLITYQTGYTYDTKIWIDWNDDLDFADPGEEVYLGTSSSANPTTLAASFNVPLTAPLGNHRMRIGGVDFGPPTPCYTGSWGSFEDYTVNVISEPTCLPPTNLVTSNITSGSAQLSFDVPPLTPGAFFDVFYAIDGNAPGDPGTTLSGVIPPVTIADLEENTAYNWYTRSVCGFDVPDIDHFWMAIDELSQLVPASSGGSTEVMEPGEDMTWYQYQAESGDFWYNIWFYNDPFDATRMKIIKMGFYVQRLNPLVEGNIYYVFNWSTPDWNPVNPAFPMPAEEIFVDRSPTNGPLPVIAADIDHPYGQWVELSFIIPDFNPAWVSVDIFGDNIIITQQAIEPPMESPLHGWWLQSPLPGGILVHECVPKPSGNSSPWEGPAVFTTLAQCPAPTNLAVSNITTNSAELSWVGPIDSFFDVFFGPGSDPFTGNLLSTVSSPLVVNDLEPGADYGFYVRTDCGFEAPKVDYFWMAMDAPGILLPPLSGGTYNEPNENGIWYLYDNAPGEMNWWNIWFYNDPVDNTRMKKMRMGFWISSLNGATPGMLNYVFNWSDPTWPGPSFPTPMDEAFIHRSPVNGPMPIPPGAPIWVELYYIIPDYNPEWVSVDIWGENIQILQLAPQAPPAGSPLAQYWVPGSPGGIIVHECLPKNSGPTSQWSGPILFSTLCPTQLNLPLCESFDPPTSTVPNCWTEQLEGLIITPHWTVLGTNFAGGLQNEAVAVYSPGEGATLADNDRLVSPPLNTNGMTSINLSFKQYLDDYNAGVNDVWVKVQSSSDGLAWTDEWVYPAGLGVDILAENKNLVISNNLGSTTYLAWTLSGYTFDINSWHVDDICIYESCASITWTGAVSTAWNNPDNWSCGILPNNLTTVQIPAGLTNYPIVPAGITAYCFQVDLAAGATLSVESGGVLKVTNP